MIDHPHADAALSDPMERVIAEALLKAGVRFITDEGGKNPTGLDFGLPDLGIEIEVKRMHSPRIADQMSRAENVIAAQGETAVRWLSGLISPDTGGPRLREALKSLCALPQSPDIKIKRLRELIPVWFPEIAQNARPDGGEVYDARWEAFRKGAMFALGRSVWADADDFFTLYGIEYAKGGKLPSNPMLTPTQTEPADNQDGRWEVNVAPSRAEAGAWVVEEIDESRKGEGDVLVTLFSGLRAEDRARAYATIRGKEAEPADPGRVTEALRQAVAHARGEEVPGLVEHVINVEDVRKGALRRVQEWLGGDDDQVRLGKPPFAYVGDLRILIALATPAPRLATGEEALRSALRAWKCPSCGGAGTYVNRSKARGEEVVPCKVCRLGDGLHPIASAALKEPS